jgi:hypothetical protein
LEASESIIARATAKGNDGAEEHVFPPAAEEEGRDRRGGPAKAAAEIIVAGPSPSDSEEANQSVGASTPPQIDLTTGE